MHIHTSMYVEKNEVRLFCWCLCEGVSRSSHESNMQKKTSQSQRAPQGLACQLPPAPWLTSADSFRHFHPHFVLTSINRNRKCHTSFRAAQAFLCGQRKRKKVFPECKKKVQFMAAKRKKGEIEKGMKKGIKKWKRILLNLCKTGCNSRFIDS